MDGVVNPQRIVRRRVVIPAKPGTEHKMGSPVRIRALFMRYAGFEGFGNISCLFNRLDGLRAGRVRLSDAATEE